jgi:hypothetical protein
MRVRPVHRVRATDGRREPTPADEGEVSIGPAERRVLARLRAALGAGVLTLQLAGAA